MYLPLGLFDRTENGVVLIILGCFSDARYYFRIDAFHDNPIIVHILLRIGEKST